MIAAEPLYVAARRVLLDALGALSEHRESVVLVGAQAVYLRCGDADLDAGVAPFTTDADLAIDPVHIADTPQIAEAMHRAGFALKIKVGGEIEPGTWVTETDVDGRRLSVPVDLLVPEALAPIHKGRRDAKLPAHGKNATRWTPGLEAMILDNTTLTIESLESADTRSVDVRVAGVPSLLVAKAHKLAERVNDEGRGKAARVKAKDAGDIVRLMQSDVRASTVGTRLREMAETEQGGTSVSVGVDHLAMLFLRSPRRGHQLAIQALAGAAEEAFIEGVVGSFMEEMLTTYRS